MKWVKIIYYPAVCPNKLQMRAKNSIPCFKLSYLGGAHWLTCLVESKSVPTYVFPRQVTLITSTPKKKGKK